MKKIICAVLAVLTAIGMTACGNGGGNVSNNASSAMSSQAAASSGTASETASSQAASDVSSIPPKGSVSFDYGDELAFYKADEGKSKNPTAIAVTKDCLNAIAKSDVAAWKKTLTKDRQDGLASVKEMNFGFKKMDVKSVDYEADARYKSQAINSEKGKSQGWTAENLAVVSATYNATYDNSVVSTPNGETTVKFLLVRSSATSPWAVQEWNYAFEE